MWQEHLPLFLLAGIALLALLLDGWQVLVNGRLRNQLGKLEEEQRRQQAKPAQEKSFSTTLTQAEQQQPGLPSGMRQTPEKYHYVAALAEQGLDAKGIAKALQLAPAEVEQLLRLPRIKAQ